MAIDKSRTKPWMKAVIIFVCLSFVLGVGFSFSGLLGATQTTPGTQTASSTSTTASVDAIASVYSADIKALEASASPNDPVANLAIAEKYFEWADAVLQTVAQAGGNTQAAQSQGFLLSAPYWQAASASYARSFKVKSGDASSTTDYAISAFYSGDTTSAVKIAEELVVRDPKFAPVHFNLGIFYANAGNDAKAKAALQKYLELEPNGVSAANAKEMLTTLP
jgi:Flp pilus assembly protein TadD